MVFKRRIAWIFLLYMVSKNENFPQFAFSGIEGSDESSLSKPLLQAHKQSSTINEHGLLILGFGILYGCIISHQIQEP